MMRIAHAFRDQGLAEGHAVSVRAPWSGLRAEEEMNPRTAPRNRFASVRASADDELVSTSPSSAGNSDARFSRFLYADSEIVERRH